MSMPKLDDIINNNHLHKPQPGDYWHERFSAHLLVLGMLENGNRIITDKVVVDDEGQYFDVGAAREITLEEHRKMVCYSGIVGFCSDVSVDRPFGKSWVETWKTTFQGRYVSIADRPPQPVKRYTINIDGTFIDQVDETKYQQILAIIGAPA